MRGAFPTPPSTPSVGSASRIAVGGVCHETNTFSPVPTTLDDFRQRAYLVGDAVLRQGRDARSALGGMLAAAAEAGATVVPTVFASATPSGLVEAAAFAHLRDDLLERLRVPRRGPLPLGGVALALHGAMVAAGEDDPEAALLEAVRAEVGSDVPVVAVLDSHANVSPRMVAAADLLLGYDTYPHVDTFERGEEAVRLLLAIRGGLRPTAALRPVPLLAPLPPQCTTAATPMREVMRLAHELERQPGVVAVTVAGGFPFADVPRAGLSVQVVTDADRPLADELADRLAAAVWDRQARFVSDGLPPEEAIERALRVARAGVPGPVVLADVADNPGAGAPGDGTALLAQLLDRGVEGAAVAALADPVAVAVAAEAGVGATVSVAVGGKMDPRAGAPVARDWRVRAVTDGRFANRGPMGTGGPTRLGRTVVLAADGVEVVVCERRVQVLEPELFRAVGIEPSARRLLVVKSSVHFRAAFEPLAAAVFAVEGPGLSGSALARLPYRHVRRPIAPLDREVRYLD